MLIYTLKRIAYIVVVFFIISIMVFFIFKAVPGDPVLTYMDVNKTDVTPERWEMEYAQTRERMGLDKPKYVQYFIWITDMVTGNFGYSMYHKRDVVDVVAAPLQNTVRINILNLIIVFAITVPLGIRSAVKRGSVFDNTVQTVTIVGNSLPGFITSILFMAFFAVYLDLLPTGGMATPGFEGTPVEMFFDKAKYMVLPLAVMTFTSLSGLTRFIRAAMIETLSMDCVRTARAKGLKEKVVIYSHAFRNAQITVITIMAGWFLGIFGGSLVIERIFKFNGMGNIMVQSIFDQDYGVVFALTMFYILISLVGHLIIDLLYAVADPRIKLT